MTLKQRIKNWWYKRKLVGIVQTSGGVPTNLDESFERLKKLLGEAEVKKFTTESEQSAIAMAHFGIGMWIRNNWGLWKGGTMKDWFKDRGIVHADDMSGIILTSFHRYLRNEPIGFMDQVEHYRKFWKDRGIDPDTMEKIPGAKVIDDVFPSITVKYDKGLPKV
jgi:hypothetical protein